MRKGSQGLRGAESQKELLPLCCPKDAKFFQAGQGVEREELISWLTDGRYSDAVFDHMMVMAPEGYEFSQSSTHKTDRSVSDHRAVILQLPGL